MLPKHQQLKEWYDSLRPDEVGALFEIEGLAYSDDYQSWSISGPEISDESSQPGVVNLSLIHI